MTILTTEPAESPSSPPTSPPPHRGWFGQFLRRLHFYAGIFVGPFILIAAISGALYAVSPQIEKAVYAHELYAPKADTYLPLAEQIDAANAFIGGGATLSAVRPAPKEGDTTRVMYADDSLGESESRAIFIDPATAEVRGDLTVYGTSGALPLRTWLDQLHRSLHLGDAGRLYSELAASWLGIIAVAGLGLWVMRAVKTRKAKEMLHPSFKRKGLRRTFSWHASVGVWAAIGMLFLSATGITWSQYGGESVNKIQTAIDWTTPAVSTSLDGSAPAGGEHAHHHGGGAPAEPVGDGPNPATFDSVLSVAQDVNVNTGLVEIKPPEDENSAWVVSEIQRSFPTEVDSVAVNGTTMEVVDRTDFKDFNIGAKLTRWGIDTHMGNMFGLPNQLVLFALASGIACMVVWGYVMWWQRRPKHDTNRKFGVTPARGVLRRSPWWGIVSVVAVAGFVAWFLPVLGVSLIGFILVDLILGWRARSKK
ncbi:PepSY-associated TM helix domain-containing protein [Brevibacterium aurantiacum]|nr:PepSY-associated TM helix domain-containing protein [Brevibacterium aurantiacum]AZL08718.1 peptidase [Brevibacterium aurantiacum]